MAEALLTLATDLLKQLGSIAVQQAQQEKNLIVGVDKEVEKLSNSFENVKVMLNNAEERQFTKAAVKPPLDQLRDLYHMMDDVLDKWNTARIKSKIQKEEKRAVTNNNPAALKKKKVPCSFLPSLSCCFGQVDNLSLRHEIGHKIEELKQTLDKILEDNVRYGFDLTGDSPVEVERTLTTSFGDVSDIIGRDDHRDQLFSNLLGGGSQEESNPRVISLVGMGGIGKSTLAQLAYNDDKIQAHFRPTIWVCVSDPFDQCKVAKAIIESIEDQSPNIIELQSLLARIRDLIRGKKFFLVLDDVWTEEFTKWEQFKNALKYGSQGSRIIVTTRKNNVSEMMESSHKKFPQAMGKLINLRHLRLVINDPGRCKLKFPNGIGKLTWLRTLSDFNIGGKDDQEGCRLGGLKNLNQLQGSFKMHGLGNVVDVEEAQNAQLKNKIHLHDLELRFGGEGLLEDAEEDNRRRMEIDGAVLNALEPPPRLEKLSIMSFRGTTMHTDWMTSLTNLKSLDIIWCSQLECLPPLGKLPLLKELRIHFAANVKKLGDEFLGIESENKSKKEDCHIINIFPELRVLKFEGMRSWEEWIGMGGKIEEVEEEKDSGLVSDPIIKIMPMLESLTIEYCPELECLPDYLRTAPLQKLHIYECPILKPRCKREGGDYWPIISHIPTVKVYGACYSDSEEDEQVEVDID